MKGSIMQIINSHQKALYNHLKQKGWNHEVISAYLKYERNKKSIIRTKRITLGTDSQKTKTYKAEWAFEAKCKNDIIHFDDLKEAEKFMKRVINSKTWLQLCGGLGRRIPVLETNGFRGKTAGRAFVNKIQLCPKNGMNSYTLLHELAHIAGYMHHDVGFRICLLKLVSRFIGRKPADELKKQFKALKLKVTISNHIKSPEQWLKTYERLENARAARAA